MPKVHEIGPLFVQVTNFPYDWGFKVLTKGWTQEIEPPFRTSKPFIVRLPKYKAIVFGRWTGTKPEEEALNGILERRDLTYEDFTEEKGWTPAPDSNREESFEDIYARLGTVDGTLDEHNWHLYYGMAKNSEQNDVR